MGWKRESQLILMGKFSTLNSVPASLQNLEYLEGEFYSWAAFGYGLDSSLTGGGGPVTGGQKAQLSPEIQAYAAQIATVSQCAQLSLQK
jgi:hypothetical protein